MLTAYLNATQLLLQNPAAPTPLYSNANLTTWINTARGQLAGESESIRVLGTLTLIASTVSYNFSSITLSGMGVQKVANVRMATIAVPGGSQNLSFRPWEWFNYFYNAQVSIVGALFPTDWTQYGQGVNGTLYLYPPPATTATVTLDTVCYPIPLVDDTTVEAIPYPWTDAVPYFAAYLALLSAQSANRQADANRMFERYTEFSNRARRLSNPSVLTYQYPQSGDIVPPVSALKPQASGV